jgi:hypothetical protein
LLAPFAAQLAFKLADNLALIAELKTFFFALAAILPELFAALTPTLVGAVRGFFFGVAADLVAPPRILRSSSLRGSIYFLIAATRFSCLTVTSNKLKTSVKNKVCGN